MIKIQLKIIMTASCVVWHFIRKLNFELKKKTLFVVKLSRQPVGLIL